MPNEQTNVIYHCPMHPEVRQDHKGVCSECGMWLIKTETSVNTSQGTDTNDEGKNTDD